MVQMSSTGFQENRGSAIDHAGAISPEIALDATPRPFQRLCSRGGSLAAVATLVMMLAVIIPSIASANDQSSIYHWDLLEGTVTQGCTQSGACSFTRSWPGSQRVQYRFTVDTAHSNRASSNVCSTLQWLGYADIPAHSQSFYDIDGGPSQLPVASGTCLLLQGRSLYGNQYNRNGIISY